MFGTKQEKIEKAVAKKHGADVAKFLEDKDIEVVKAAMAGLGQIKEDDSFNALVPFLSSPNGELRAAAAVALGELGNDHAKAFVLHAIAIEKDAAVKEAMEKAVRKLKEY